MQSQEAGAKLQPSVSKETVKADHWKSRDEKQEGSETGVNGGKSWANNCWLSIYLPGPGPAL